MPCPKCSYQPGYHTFQYIGKARNISIFYTNSQESKHIDEDMAIHVEEDTHEKPWIWILDSKQLRFTSEIYTLLQNTHLQEIWILDPTLWIRSTIRLCQIFSYAKIAQSISFLEGTHIERLEFLEKKGVDMLSADRFFECVSGDGFS